MTKNCIIIHNLSYVLHYIIIQYFTYIPHLAYDIVQNICWTTSLRSWFSICCIWLKKIIFFNISLPLIDYKFYLNSTKILFLTKKKLVDSINFSKVVWCNIFMCSVLLLFCCFIVLLFYCFDMTMTCNDLRQLKL